MARIRITREFSFEMAHALLGYNGPCKHIHGHSYRLLVTVAGEAVQRSACSDNGMVMDFGEIKSIVHEAIIRQLDHALVLNAETPEQLLSGVSGFDNVVLLPYQPSCENLLIDFAARLISKLPDGVSLFSLRLHETANSYAEWYAEDNP
jgi:6-pyruvoyltetrahydropterin/6-carboxytetrahydropterin synthase